MLYKRIRYLGPAFIKRAHQVNATSRRIHFATEHPIRRTRRKTKPAMDAVEVQWSFLLLTDFCFHTRTLGIATNKKGQNSQSLLCLLCLFVATPVPHRHGGPDSICLPDRKRLSSSSSNRIQRHLAQMWGLRDGCSQAPSQLPHDTFAECERCLQAR